jgi:hypothetical protein
LSFLLSCVPGESRHGCLVFIVDVLRRLVQLLCSYYFCTYNEDER